MGALVTVFDPQGNQGEIPQEQLAAFVKAGGMPSVTVEAPDGSHGYVPANRTQDAVARGGKLLPIDQQEVQHPGFWHAVAEDAMGFGKSLLNAGPSGSEDAGQGEAEYQEKLRSQNVPFSQRLLLALTPSGMRQSAESGDVAGVAGHTVTPVAATAAGAASPSLTEAAGDAVAAVKQPLANIVKRGNAALQTVDPDLVGIASPRAAHSLKVAQRAAQVADKYVGTSTEPAVAPEAAAPEEPTSPAPAPAKVPAKVVKQAKALGPDATARTQSQSLGQPRRVLIDPDTGEPEFSDVVAARKPPQSVAAPAATPAPNAPAATPGPAADTILQKLQANAEKISKEEAAKPGSADEDLTQQLQDSLAIVKARKAAAAAAKIPPGGVMTTAVPADLMQRWGVDPESLAAGREQTRGMSPAETEASVAKLTERYKKGQAVEPILETRDADNNLVDVDGRARVIAAHRAGIERVPIIVRRIAAAGQ